MELVPYGIEGEDSDVRAHVSIATRSVYVFSTEAGRKAANSGLYPLAPVTVGGQLRATGWLVPVDAIEHARVPIPADILLRASFRQTDNTTERGRKAERVVYEMIQRGLIPLPADVWLEQNREAQIAGIDLVVVPRRSRLQVKCDWYAGPKTLRGTGNLFIQAAEANPLGLH